MTAEATWPGEMENGREHKTPSPILARASCFGPGSVLAPGMWGHSKGLSPVAPLLCQEPALTLADLSYASSHL